MNKLAFLGDSTFVSIMMSSSPSNVLIWTSVNDIHYIRRRTKDRVLIGISSVLRICISECVEDLNND